MGQEKKQPKPQISLFPFSLTTPKWPSPWMVFQLFLRSSNETFIFCPMDIHDDISWQDNENASPPSTCPPYNNHYTLIRKYNTDILYTIMIVVFLLFCYVYAKVWFWKNQSLYISQICFHLRLWASFLSLRLCANGLFPVLL